MPNTKQLSLGCSLLLNKVHCFGGYQTPSASDTNTFLNPSTDHFFLDLTQFDFKGNVSTAATNWTTVLPGAESMTPPQPLGFLNAASIAHQTQFMIYGGASQQGIVTHPIMVYDPSKNQWSSIQTFGNYT